MQLFQSINLPDLPESQFSANHDICTTANIGNIIPIDAIEYFPGDRFNLNYSHEVDFPPLLSPTFQRFSLKQYMFKVRHGLTWNNDELAKDISSMSDGSSHVMPPCFFTDNNINADCHPAYWFGTNALGFKFAPNLPCYAIVRNNQIYMRKPHTGEVSVNAWLYGLLNLSLTDAERAAYTTIASNAFRFGRYNDTTFTKKFWYYQYDPQLATGTDAQTFGAYAPYTPVALANTITANSETFYKMNKTSETWTVRYNVPPMAHQGGLLDHLGYPVMRYDDAKDEETWHAAFTQFTESYRDVQSATLPRFGVNIYGQMLDDDSTFYNQVKKLQGNGTYVGFTLISLLQQYIEFCAMIGKADGTIPTDDELPLFGVNQELDFYNNTNSKIPDDCKYLSALRFNAFWLVYNTYFRDESVQPTPMNLYTQSGYNYLPTQDYINYTGLSHDEFNKEFPVSNPNLEYLKSIFNYYRLPQKMIDRDYFSSLLPNVSAVKVAAPCHSSLAADEVSVDKSNVPDYTPSTTISASAFLSLDSLRTASYLQRFFEKCYLAGSQPVQQILAIYGVHSQDFRHEIPVLLSANEVTISPTEITQMSETSELPLGSEGGKLTMFSQQGSEYIDSDGDHGIILPIICVYPVQRTIFGLDPRLMCANQYQMRFIPEYSTLGEEEVKVYSYQFMPQSGLALDPTKLDDTLGYIPRYADYKFLPDRISGRFNSDLRYWNGQPLPTASANKPSLSYDFMKTPDTRELFVTNEDDMLKIHSYCSGDFVRKIADIPAISLH